MSGARLVRRWRPVPLRTSVALALPGALLLGVPLGALVLRAPWSTFLSELRMPSTLAALRVSILVATAATAVTVVVGTPLAWVLARADVPGRRIVRALTLVPLVLPPVVGGVALLAAFGRRGVLGSVLDTWFGVTLPFTTAGAVLAATFVSMPFYVLAAESAFATTDHRVEAAAATLGASPSTVAVRVTLPLARSALGAGAVLAWARALGEFGATITFAGNAAGRTATVPVEVYVLLESGDAAGATALSLLLLVVAAAVLVGLRDRWVGRW